MMTHIKFINKSMNRNLPQVFITANNEISAFNSLVDGIAWRVIKKIGRGSIANFYFDTDFTIRAGWDNGVNLTRLLPAIPGKKYEVTQDDTGVVLEEMGNSADQNIIELVNNICVDNGLLAQLYNDNKIIMGKKIVGYKQSAVFKPARKLYWGLASEICEGKGLASESAILNTSDLFELDLDGVSEVLVSLNGNARGGYYFQVESRS
ncbi:hypothetical protein [Vibrio quintilis]|uniref:Uncharacterized protein n=1 Tax=Vibrio quintilis TaxID=1117707 RepID=A0A1M7Z1R5_9VIBR|nr:hypothetical protein [Vibrio quintilis]SHO58907.1 hypothetical protein VQ7734_04682 [Vibrio quintilis]